MKTAATLLMLFTLFSVNTFAQHSMQLSLPEGAKARLGKSEVKEIRYSPDGTRLVVASRIGIWLYDTVTYQAVALFTGHTDSIYSVTFSPDGNTLASGSTDDTVRLWDVKTGTNTHTLTGHTSLVNSVAFSPDGNTLASGSWEEIRLWDVSTGTHTRTLTGHSGGVRSVAFSPDGNTLASGSWEGTILLWGLTPSGPTHPPQAKGDVNGDGVVNILDLVSVADSLESEASSLTADVNGDGVINVLDLIWVAGLFESTAAAPAARLQVPETLTAVGVQQWLTDATELEVKTVIMKRGIMVLGQLLAALTPTETALLPNYPNPFNPETWIPYRLAEDAFVTLTIYDLDGQVVRTLDVGHRMASAYETRSKAIYWDGRNQLGEPVASGVYYYHLSAGEYATTRKMLVIK